MTNNKDRDEDDALMQSFRLLREDVPEGLHSRIVQVATHMPQHKVAPAEAAPHDVIWGLFVFGDHYGGGFTRLIPRGVTGVINAARGALEGVLFEVP